MNTNSASTLRDGIDTESYMASPLILDGPTTGWRCGEGARSPAARDAPNVPLKMPRIYDMRVLRAGLARNPSGVIRPARGPRRGTEFFRRLAAPAYFASFLAFRYQSRICSPFQCSTPFALAMASYTCSRYLMRNGWPLM